LAILGNVSGPHVVLEMREVQAAARTLGLEAITSEIRRAEDIPPAFEALKGRAEALYVVNDSLVSSNRVGINTLALSGRLPTMHGFREYVEAGGLMSYGANFPDLFRRAADLVDKILRGAKPGDIPAEQPTKFELVINLPTARALGIDVPTALLARAVVYGSGGGEPCSFSITATRTGGGTRRSIMAMRPPPFLVYLRGLPQPQAAVRHQAAVGGVEAKRIHGGQATALPKKKSDCVGPR
jgi:hypothetical protein